MFLSINHRLFKSQLSRAPERRGVTTVEGAIILSTVLLLLFAMLDLGLAAFRYNALSYAARRVARAAIVHGAEAPPEYSAWGPSPYTATAADGSEIAQTAIAVLPTMKAEEVTIEVTWLDGDNQEDDQVRVRMSYDHDPIIPFMMLSSSLDLQAECTMRIQH